MGGTTPDRSSEELTPSMGELQAEMLELRQELDRERLLRLMLEDRARSLEAQLYHPQRPAHLSPSHVPTQMNLKVVSVFVFIFLFFFCGKYVKYVSCGFHWWLMEFLNVNLSDRAF